jgi:hypothetical protein
MRSRLSRAHHGSVMNQSIPISGPEVPQVTTRQPEAWHELACRRTGGTLVRLYWRPRENDVFVYVKDEQTGEDFVLEPPKDSALTAFYHPFALRKPPRR